MADDENGTTTTGAETPEHRPSPAETDRSPSTTPPATSEWTVSDARGPMHAAADDPQNPASSPGLLTGDHDSVDHVPPSDPVETHHTESVVAASEPVGPADVSPDPVVTEARRGLALPIIAGVILGAIIGAGSAALVYAFAGGAGEPSQEVASLSSRVDALDKRPDPQQALGTMQATMTALAGRVAGLQKTVAGPAQSPPPPTPGFDPLPLQQKVAALQSAVDALQKQGGDTQGLAGKLEGVEAALATAQKQASAAQAGVTDVQGQQKSLEGKLNAPALAVVADSLVQQIDRGLPYATQVDALASIGGDPARIAILRQNADKGVPSAKVLADKFEPLADPIAATAQKAPANAGFMDKLKSGLFSMVSVRRVDDTTGTDVASRVSRIEADLGHDDVADAAATWDALPADAKAKSEAWGALAKTHAEAMAAARALQRDAITALGAKKS
jgi:hypothetical protein